MTKKISSWSFSRFKDYRQCPLRAKFKHVDRMKEPSSAPMERGTKIHGMCEGYLRGEIDGLPEELTAFRAEFDRLRTLHTKKILGPLIEETWAFRKDWSVTRWDDWSGCWLRIKVDYAHYEGDDTLCITDWKTGKFHASMCSEYMDQIELYALGALLALPHVNRVKARLVYLDVGRVYPPPSDEVEHTRHDLGALKAKWEHVTESMLVDTTFEATPGYYCRWCHFRKDNGGPCTKG